MIHIAINPDRGVSADSAEVLTVVRGILDAIEPGASKHCLRIERGARELCMEHVRLGVVVTVYER